MIHKENLVSIIVPIYNVEKYVEKCILSIINQTYNNLQIILVDDGSTDASGEICDFYAEKDQRIKVIHQKNAGLVCARKRGLKEAKGQYIGFVDGDDYIDKIMYEEMLDAILESKADFVHTGYFVEKGAIIKTSLDYESKVYDIRDSRKQFLYDFIIDISQDSRMGFSIWSKLFKRDLIIKCYQKIPDNQSYGEDVLALYRCILESDVIYLKRKSYYHYVYRNDSMTNSNWINIQINLISLYKSIQDLLKEYDLNSILERPIEKWILTQIIGNINSAKIANFYIQRFFYPDILSLRGKKIVLYGAGAVGQDYYFQLSNYQDIQIVAWGDKNAGYCSSEYMEIVDLERLKEFDYDFLIIAVKNSNIAKQIRKELIQNSVREDKIKWLKPIF